MFVSVSVSVRVPDCVCAWLCVSGLWAVWLCGCLCACLCPCLCVGCGMGAMGGVGSHTTCACV